MTSLHPSGSIRRWLRGHWGPKVDAASIRNKELEIELQKDRVAIRDRKMIAVLGGSGVGKSTFLRQVKLFGFGYDDTEREELGASIQASLMESMRLILKDSNAISDDPELENYFSFFIEATSKGQSLTPELSAIIRNIWANPKAKEAIRASRRFQEHSTFLEYLLDSLARVAAPGYIPTDSDIILCNLPPPPPITEMPFSYPDRNSLPPTLVRVRHNIGLQRKWIHIFSDAEAIIFIVDLTCYDQTVYSADTDEHLNRMRETMRQFESVCNFPGMASRTAILVMNKFDLFAEKLATVPFTECFPEYDGPNEAHAAAIYCIQRFAYLSATSGWWRPMETRGWCTNALDTDQMRVPLQEMMAYILMHRFAGLHSSGGY